jgi:Ca-activated chloride channel homolog
MDFRFEQPWYLLLALLLPLAWWAHHAWQRPATIRYAPAHIFAKSGELRRSLAPLLQKGLFFLGCLLLVVGIARPQFGLARAQVQASGIDIMLVLDVSRSMLAEDFTIGNERANRLEAVKQVTEKFIQGRPNDRIGIVAFAGRPYPVSPLTLDHQWLLQSLERLRIGLTEDGTAIGSAIVSAANRLRESKARSRIMLLLTDGDNNAGRVLPPTAAEAAVALGIKIYAVGAGSNGLVLFPQTDRLGHTFYIREYMPLDEDALRRIAEIGRGQYYRATDTKTLEGIFQQIDQLEKNEIHVQEYRHYNDLFGWFAGAAAAILVSITVLGETIWRRIP